MPGPVIWRRDDGGFGLDFDAGSRDVLAELCDMLEDAVRQRNELTTRLFPPPYGDDAERNEGYAALAGPELVERRLDAIALMRSTLRADHVDEEGLLAWMRCINDMRLVLGTILGVEDDGVEPEPTRDTLPVWATYESLGALLDGIVDVLSE
jgi:hypothetical protein